MRTRVVVVLLLTAGLLGLIGFWHPVTAQSAAPLVLCAPCSGKDFNVPSDRGMALMTSSGEIRFYPLNQAPPIRIGLLSRLGTPIAWDSKLAGR